MRFRQWYLLGVVAKVGRLRRIEIVQLTVQHVETKETHLGQGNHSHSVGQPVSHGRSAVAGRDTCWIVEFLLLGAAATRSHRARCGWARGACTSADMNPQPRPARARHTHTALLPLASTLAHGGPNTRHKHKKCACAPLVTSPHCRDPRPRRANRRAYYPAAAARTSKSADFLTPLHHSHQLSIDFWVDILFEFSHLAI